MELEQELRSASDELLQRLDRLRELELEKRRLQPGTPRFVAVADEVEKLAASLLTKSAEQEHLGEEAVRARHATGVLTRPIEKVAPPREVGAILSEWREAERRLAAAHPGTAEHREAQADVQRLRTEYREAYNAVSNDSEAGDER